MGRVVVAREQPAHLLAGLPDQADAGVGVDVQRGGDVGVTADLLDRLGVYAGLNHRREVAVPEDMRRRAEHIHLFIDVAQHPPQDHLRQRLLAADDVAGGSPWLQESGQLIVERDDAVAAACLRGRNQRLVGRIGDRPPHADQLGVEVDVLPPQAERLSATHAGEQYQCNETPFRVIRQFVGDVRDDLLELHRRERVSCGLLRGDDGQALAFGGIGGNQPILKRGVHDLRK